MELVTPKIVIADRSLLAKNLYQLLFAPFRIHMSVYKQISEVKFNLKHDSPKLVIISSNVFRNKIEEVIDWMLKDEFLISANKIFLCKENSNEEVWQKELCKLPKTKVVMRPFHPDEFATLAKKIIF